MPDYLYIDDSNCRDFLSDSAHADALDRVRRARQTLLGRSGPGSEFLGWVDLPAQVQAQLADIQEAADQLRESSDVVIVIGIGGSYLGARAVIDALRSPFAADGPEIIYAGHHIDGAYLKDLLRHVEDRRVSLNVISKSGTTTEPALAFRVLRDMMHRRYGREEAARRIVATTDAQRGALRKVAEEEGYRRFVIPDDVGGRFSVFTPVGLLPIAAAGMDIHALVGAAADMRHPLESDQPDENPALHYAMLRDALYREGKVVEVLASFEPRLQYVTEWWKQLFGESEGKDGNGIFPAAVSNTTDLHSMGQYIQDGRRMLFETFLVDAAPGDSLLVPAADDDTDGLNYLAGSSLADINRSAMRGTALAHRSGGVPNAVIEINGLSPRTLGALLYFFESTVALSGYALGVNPFDQPGVEEYKRNMFALLRKPGYEDLYAQLTAQLKGGA